MAQKEVYEKFRNVEVSSFIAIIFEIFPCVILAKCRQMSGENQQSMHFSTIVANLNCAQFAGVPGNTIV